MSVTGKFRHGKEDIPMSIGYVFATTILQERFNIDILNIMRDQSAVATILIDDGTMLKLWYHFIKESTDQTWEEALEILDDSQAGLEPFRKAFWDLVVGFSPTVLQPTLKSMKRQVEKELKNLPEATSTTSTSASQPDSE